MGERVISKRFSRFVSFSQILVERNESAYVWTRKLLNPQQNICLRIQMNQLREAQLNNSSRYSTYTFEF